MTRFARIVVLAACAAVLVWWWRLRVAASRARADDAAGWPPLTASDQPSPDGAGPPPPAGWVSPDEHGACPIGHPVKAKESSGIFHEPTGRVYDRTKADRCYVDAAAAAADGFRPSQV